MSNFLFNHVVYLQNSLQYEFLLYRRFIGSLRRMGQERGMRIPEPSLVRDITHPNPESDLPNIKRISQDRIQLVLIVLPNQGDLYGMYRL